MAGKICLVTGANSGLGKASALELAKQGATVVLACRDRAKGEAVQAEIKAASGQSELLIIDLGSQRSVREAAAQFCQQHNTFDVLVNNAALYKTSRSMTPDGLEAMF